VEKEKIPHLLMVMIGWCFRSIMRELERANCVGTVLALVHVTVVLLRQKTHDG
jgi:hypothetical protein